MRLPTPAAVLVALATATCVLAVPHAGAAAANPCALVTTAEATTAMGVTSLPGKPRTSVHSSSCRFYSADHTKNVFVQTIAADDMQGMKQLGGKTVPGIGDEAVWSSGSLFIRKGGSYMQVGLYRSAASMQKMDPQIVPLGKAAASRM